MSGYTNFAVIGAGGIGNHIVQQLLKDKAAAIVKEVVVLTRQYYSRSGRRYPSENRCGRQKRSLRCQVVRSLGVWRNNRWRDGGVLGAKADVQSQLKALDMPFAAFYTGLFADYAWVPYFDLDVKSGKVSIGGDGNKPFAFTSRTDIARYVSYVLTHLPAEQLKNRAFAIAGDTKTFNEVFKMYDEKTGKKIV
ncbi:hypothetical protein BGY98DRAFT_934746 [Russula aff. rugulosa BPL654]|nr:hypothetical protein BGY98DRAFT_934746 [Russula aff. rugulosa BPL654]